jgi:hypothetical protein
MSNLEGIAKALPKTARNALDRPAKHKVKTQSRQRPENVNEQIVREREFKNIRLICEDVAEFSYSPTFCEKAYRVVVVRKNLSVEMGEAVLFDGIRYFFYITNDASTPADEPKESEATSRAQDGSVAATRTRVGADGPDPVRTPADGRRGPGSLRGRLAQVG